MLASKSRSAKMLGSVKDTKTSSATRDKKENQSWSELVEDEESEKVHVIMLS